MKYQALFLLFAAIANAAPLVSQLAKLADDLGNVSQGLGNAAAHVNAAGQVDTAAHTAYLAEASRAVSDASRRAAIASKTANSRWTNGAVAGWTVGGLAVGTGAIGIPVGVAIGRAERPSRPNYIPVPPVQPPQTGNGYFDPFTGKTVPTGQ